MVGPTISRYRAKASSFSMQRRATTYAGISPPVSIVLSTCLPCPEPVVTSRSQSYLAGPAQQAVWGARGDLAYDGRHASGAPGHRPAQILPRWSPCASRARARGPSGLLFWTARPQRCRQDLSLIHISEPTRLGMISY